MSEDIRRSRTYQTLLNCLIKRIRAERESILDRTDTAGPITEDSRQNSMNLAAADEALTRIGIFDTR